MRSVALVIALVCAPLCGCGHLAELERAASVLERGAAAAEAPVEPCDEALPKLEETKQIVDAAAAAARELGSAAKQ